LILNTIKQPNVGSENPVHPAIRADNPAKKRFLKITYSVNQAALHFITQFELNTMKELAAP
jgi:hypothetical protein